MCAYLMFQFPTALVIAVFLMLFLAFLWDILLFRVLLCLVIALWTRRRARLEGGLRFAKLERPSSDEETPRAAQVEDFITRRPGKDAKIPDEDERQLVLLGEITDPVLTKTLLTTKARKFDGRSSAGTLWVEESGKKEKSARDTQFAGECFDTEAALITARTHAGDERNVF